ncbi:inositol monophosphatase family protein [Phytomonospora endophytica]|uniref:inositol monophosphatase family protein n=1 Tax=Phytomonospora endophytica TaxID=714109 RepID=UPI00161C552B|nr:inositol monophosphatase family protein [Phytomonospora endophytica]
MIPDEHDIPSLLELALATAAEAAGLAAAERAVAVSRISTKSTVNDVVTAADKAAEELIVARLSAARPGDSFIGEEGGSRGEARDGVRWIVDPIDGTVNYVYGMPYYAVSLAAEARGRLLVGVVRNIATGTVYHASAGAGAFRDGLPVRCNEPAELGRSMLATGFGYDPDQRARQGALLAGVIPHVRDIRRTGSAALDLCMVADGTVDAYYESGPNVWDYAAGGIIAAEAGAVVGGLWGDVPGRSMILAAAPAIAGPLRGLLQSRKADTAYRSVTR